MQKKGPENRICRVNFFCDKSGRLDINVQEIKCVASISFATIKIVATSTYECRHVATIISDPTFCRDKSVRMSLYSATNNIVVSRH